MQGVGQEEDEQLDNNDVVNPNAGDDNGVHFSRCLALSNIDGTSHGVVCTIHLMLITLNILLHIYSVTIENVAAHPNWCQANQQRLERIYSQILRFT